MSPTLDIAAFEAILKRAAPGLQDFPDGGLWLDLKPYPEVDDAVFEYLAERMFALESIELGLRRLRKRAARALCRLDLGVLELLALETLDADAAHLLGTWPFETRPIRHLCLQRQLMPADGWLGFTVVELSRPI